MIKYIRMPNGVSLNVKGRPAEEVKTFDGTVEELLNSLVESTDEMYKEKLRARRRKECFSVINRGQYWYEILTEAQNSELKAWYIAWLNAPETGIVPEKPSWLEAV